MKRITLGILALVFALPITVLAQGSGSSHPPSSSGSVESDQPASFAVTRSVKGKIVEVAEDKQTVVVEDKKGKRFEVKVGKDTKYKAAKKTELAGRDDITLSDFESGQVVKITYLASNNLATELELLPTKN